MHFQIVCDVTLPPQAAAAAVAFRPLLFALLILHACELPVLQRARLGQLRLLLRCRIVRVRLARRCDYERCIKHQRARSLAF